jgi:hypothetical protein
MLRYGLHVWDLSLFVDLLRSATRAKALVSFELVKECLVRSATRLSFRCSSKGQELLEAFDCLERHERGSQSGGMLGWSS